MSLSRRISANRTTVIFVVLVVLSLASLATGRQGNLISNAIGTGVSVVAYPFWQALDKVENGVNYATGFVVAYDSARTEAQNLREKIGALTPEIADLQAVQAENNRLRHMLEFERTHPALTLKAADVISNASGVLTINRGSMHGVQEAMCAMTPDGIVGIVTRVEPSVSKVATLRSDSCKIGVMISRDKRVQAALHGSASDFSPRCRMEYLDAKEVVRKGDEVLTMGSGVFPSEFKVGRIVDIEPGSLFQVAYVEPYADPNAIDEVFLVSRAQPQLAEFIGEASQDSAAHMAFSMPDKRSIQDRFAP